MTGFTGAFRVCGKFEPFRFGYLNPRERDEPIRILGVSLLSRQLAIPDVSCGAFEPLLTCYPPNLKVRGRRPRSADRAVAEASAARAAGVDRRGAALDEIDVVETTLCGTVGHLADSTRGIERTSMRLHGNLLVSLLTVDVMSAGKFRTRQTRILYTLLDKSQAVGDIACI